MLAIVPSEVDDAASCHISLNNSDHQVAGSNGAEYKAIGKTNVYALATDLALVWDAEFKDVAQEYAADNKLFLYEFSSAWALHMDADRYHGPSGNVCYEYYY